MSHPLVEWTEPFKTVPETDVFETACLMLDVDPGMVLDVHLFAIPNRNRVPQVTITYVDGTVETRDLL